MMAEVEEAAVSLPTVEVDEKPKIDNLGRAYSTGKRKDAVARVWIKKGSGKITVNKKPRREILCSSNSSNDYSASILSH